jgi:hypothetical protein
MLEEINNNYLLEQQQCNDANNDNNNDPVVVIQEHNVMRINEAANAEILLYTCEPSIPLQNAQQRFTCPLSWWKSNQTKCRLLSEVALCLLCIPATSAPSERVFSVAGLTIAKGRVRMAPQTANEMIFLHDATSAIRKYYDLCTTL